MNNSRRNVLKGIVALGSASALALATPIWASALVTNSSKIHLIIANDNVGQSFLTGAKLVKEISIESTLVGSTSTQFIQQYQNILKQGKNQRIFGLVDDASAVLITDLARSADARVIWLEDHAISSTDNAKNLGTGLVGNNSKAINASTTNTMAFNKRYVSFLIES